jgi:hypothetical protein
MGGVQLMRNEPALAEPSEIQRMRPPKTQVPVLRKPVRRARRIGPLPMEGTPPRDDAARVDEES